MRWRRSAAGAPCRASRRCCRPAMPRRPRSSFARWGSSAMRGWSTPCCRFMARPERELRIEAMQALSKLVDERRAEQLRTELQSQAVSPDQTIARVASRRAGGARPPPGGRRRRSPAARRFRRPPAAASPAPARPADGGDARRTSRRGRAIADRRRPVAARHPDAQARRHHRGPLQVHRPHRPRRLRHRAADGGYGRRRAADPEVPEPERVGGRRGHEALRPRAALLAQDHAQERHPHLRLPLHPGQLRHLHGVLPLAHPGGRDRRREADRAEAGAAVRHATCAPA